MTKKVKFNHGKFFSEVSKLETGSKISKVQILRTGSWSHPNYGDFSISEADLDEFVFNFNAKILGHDICVDENHDWGHKALGWYKELIREGNALFAMIEWNDVGLEKINSGEYKYFSPELYFSYKPADSNQVFKNVLVWGWITNRPFFKNMQALKMSESESTDNPSLYFFDTDLMKKTFSELIAQFSTKEKLTQAEVDSLKLAFSELPEEEKTQENTVALEKEETKLSDADHEVPKDEDKGDDTDKDADKAGDDTTKSDPPPADTTVQASEKDQALLAKFSEDEKKSLLFALTGMTGEQIKEVQSTASKLQKEKTFSETKTRFEWMTFSEKNKKGFLNPNSVQKFAEFSVKLPESLRTEFEALFSENAFIDPAFFTEIGAGEKNTSTFSVWSETPEGVTRESFVQSTIAQKLFSEGKAKSVADAMPMAKRIIAENNIQ